MGSSGAVLACLKTQIFSLKIVEHSYENKHRGGCIDVNRKGFGPRPLATRSLSRAGRFSTRKKKLHRRTGLGSSGEFQGCFGGIAERSMLRALVHSRHK